MKMFQTSQLCRTNAIPEASYRFNYSRACDYLERWSQQIFGRSIQEPLSYGIRLCRALAPFRWRCGTCFVSYGLDQVLSPPVTGRAVSGTRAELLQSEETAGIRKNL